MSRLGDSSDHKFAEGEGKRFPLDTGDRQIARPGWLKNGNKPGNPHECPRCGAQTRRGTLCLAPAMPNGRCRMHGGTSTGPSAYSSEAARRQIQVRIPSDADQRSELMPIAIPISCRSPFQSDGDHRSNPRPISSGRV